MRPEKGTVFVSSFFVLFGGIILLWCACELYHGYASLIWPNTPGELLKVGVTSGTAPAAGLTYQPQIAYRYQVDQKEYTATRLGYARIMLTSNQKRIANVISAYDPNLPVAVHYDPQNPKRAVLLPGISRGFYFIVFLGVACVAAGIYLICAKPKGPSRKA